MYGSKLFCIYSPLLSTGAKERVKQNDSGHSGQAMPFQKVVFLTNISVYTSLKTYKAVNDLVQQI